MDNTLSSLKTGTTIDSMGFELSVGVWFMERQEKQGRNGLWGGEILWMRSVQSESQYREWGFMWGMTDKDLPASS